MKILAVMGSPHKGNTLEITQKIENKMQRFHDVEFEYVHLKDVELKPCLGCFTCFVKGEAACPLKDDKELISKKLDEADGVIFVSPVYSMHVTYLMKTFIDRFAYNFHRPRYFGKYAAAIAAAGFPGLKETLKYMKMVAVSWGFEFVDSLGVIAPPKNTDIPLLVKQEDRTGEIADKLYGAVKEKKPRKLSFSDYLHFESMRAIYSDVEPFLPVDYAYFKENGWLAPETEHFHHNVRGGVIKRLAAKAMTTLMKMKLKKARVN